MHQIKTNQNRHFMPGNFFFRKSCRLWDNTEKYGGTKKTTDNMAHARCMLDKYDWARASTSPRPHTQTHTHIHTRAHAHKHVMLHVHCLLASNSFCHWWIGVLNAHGRHKMSCQHVILCLLLRQRVTCSANWPVVVPPVTWDPASRMFPVHTEQLTAQQECADTARRGEAELDVNARSLHV